MRAAFLRAAAALLEEEAEAVVVVADAETALGTDRLTAELAGTAYQLRAFADVVDEGEYLDVTIDHAAGLTSSRPDLRRYKLPLGVVAVYGASNFPLAFSVPGSDTASALAAGCPVVVNAHPDHPATSELCAALLRRAAERGGLPAAVLGLVHGFDAGVALINHPLVRAAGFTGSERGGRALYDAAARPHPIPFYGELGSFNPVVISEAAARERAEAIGEGLTGSMTLGVGQFCVKPGLVLAPATEAGDRVLASLTAAAAATPPGVRAGQPGEGAGEPGPEAPDCSVRAGVLTVPAAHLAAEGPYDLLLEECFGPVTVVARYAREDEIGAVLRRLPGNLTSNAQLSAAECGVDGVDGADETDGPQVGEPGQARRRVARLLEQLTPLAGRLLVNGWPPASPSRRPSTTAARTRPPPPPPRWWAPGPSTVRCARSSTRTPRPRCSRPNCVRTTRWACPGAWTGASSRAPDREGPPALPGRRATAPHAGHRRVWRAGERRRGVDAPGARPA